MYGMDQFENELKELRIVLSDVQKQQFEEYYKLLVEWNEVMNLTAITDYKDVMKKHFFDSLTVVRAYPEILTGAVSVIDIGTRRRVSGNSAENCISADSTDFTGFFTKTIEVFTGGF